MSFESDIRTRRPVLTLRSLYRLWPVMLLAVLTTTGAALVFSLTSEKTYTATASLLFRDSNLDDKLFGSAVFGNSGDPTRAAATNVRLVQLTGVAQRTSLALDEELTADEVQVRVKVSSEGASDLVSVAADAGTPEEAATLSNTFAREFIAFRQAADRAKITDAQNLVQTQLGRLTSSQRDTAQGRSLQQRADQLRVLAALQTGNAELVQQAEAPDHPSSPKTAFNVVVGMVLGVFLGGLAIFAAERTNRRLRDADEFAALTEIPLIGTVPLGSGDFVAFDDVAQAEAFRLIRTNLTYFDVDNPIRSIGVTSPEPGDGKTTVAYNLARAAASLDSGRVLLIETDLRRPTMASRLGLNTGLGLSAVLANHASFDDAVQQIDLNDDGSNQGGARGELDILVAGALPPNPAGLLASGALRELLALAHEHYDFVVCDTAPVALVADAIPVLTTVSGVLVVARVGRTDRRKILGLTQQLRQLRVHVLGGVANGVSTSGAYGYGTYAGYAERSASDATSAT